MKTALFLLATIFVGSLVAAEPLPNVSAIERLKDAPAKALVEANCIPCHSTAIIAANHLSRAEWDATISTMQLKNGMWPLPDAIRKMILDYLEVAQRPEDRGLNQGKSTPWASPLYSPNPIWK